MYPKSEWQYKANKMIKESNQSIRLKMSKEKIAPAQDSVKTKQKVLSHWARTGWLLGIKAEWKYGQMGLLEKNIHK